ncbi:MAG: hypothetical protein DI586_06775 [Micavibrio aeruginosavorus]|uniref:N-acetyltransferase domain-containing protein n=1 Tax=Micavibrio aeruginosavorus TaxID=349221 RepID=A0A2W5HBI6_9BACT|nr:MAG: hypothetical protein DI586_06775 [Micavibrio aeruginosavorus]
MQENNIVIRLATTDDVASLEAIEKSAARKFQKHLNIEDTGTTVPLEILIEAQAKNLLWVITHETDKIGFLCSRLVDKQPHIEEFSIDFTYQGNGYGREFLRFFINWAKNSGYKYISLTTDKIIPWNAPFYARYGFEKADPDENQSELSSVLLRDKTKNPIPENRIAMIYNF